MKIQTNQFYSIEQLQDQYLNQTEPKKQNQTTTVDGLSFQDILNQKTGRASEGGEVRFSKHAAGRLHTRNIQLTDNQLERLKEGTRKANEKGIQESLVLVDSLAFIVNVPNQTVVTAMDQTETKENVFTNIDGTVIM